MDPTRETLSEEAAAWLVRLDEASGPSCHEQFVAWLKQSPRHIDEFLMVEATYRSIQDFHPRNPEMLRRLLEDASSDVGVVPLFATPATAPVQLPAAVDGRLPAPPRGKGWERLPARAAAIAVMAVLSFLAARWALEPLSYATAIGEQRAFKLPDGSLLNLNTNSRVDIDFSGGQRNVRLRKGEALFTVKKDADHPFRVLVEDTVVQAVGTAFNVYRRSDESTLISVVEGRVNVIAAPIGDASAQQSRTVLSLAAGDEATVSKATGAVQRKTPDVTQSVSWPQRRLVFRATELAAVIEQFNRYNAENRLRVDASDVAQRRITGTFDADAPDAFLKFLAEDPTIQLKRESNEIVIGAKEQRLGERPAL